MSVTTEDGKVSCKTAEGSVININVLQQSSRDSLNDGVNISRKIWSEAPSTAPMSPPSNDKATALPLVLGVSQLPMGIICVAVYAFSLTTDFEIFRGAPLWMGIPFLLSGPSEVVAYIKNQGFWVFLSVVSQMLNFSVSVTGLVFTEDAASYRIMYYLKDDTCERLQKNAQPSSYQTYDLSQNSYSQHFSYYQSDALKECQQAVNMAKDLSYGLLILMLIICSWGVISSTIAIIYRLKTQYEVCSPYKELAEEDHEPLEKTPPYSIIV